MTNEDGCARHVMTNEERAIQSGVEAITRIHIYWQGQLPSAEQIAADIAELDRLRTEGPVKITSTIDMEALRARVNEEVACNTIERMKETA